MIFEFILAMDLTLLPVNCERVSYLIYIYTYILYIYMEYDHADDFSSVFMTKQKESYRAIHVH